MNSKINPWMISTIFLFGLITGFIAGRFAPSAPSTSYAAANTAGTTTIAANTVGGAANNQQLPSLQTAATIDFGSIEKSFVNGHYGLGNKNAKVKIVDYSDFQCPFCSRYFTQTFQQILTDYVATGKAYYTFYNYPLDIHPQAQKASEAALCAGEQNKFWEYHDLLFTNQDVWSFQDNTYLQTFKDMAQALNLDMGKFNDCLNSDKFQTSINQDLASGQKESISGTPSFLINKQKIIGAETYATFKKTIDGELK